MVGDEVAGWIARLNAYATGPKGDESVWLSIFGARPLIVDRKTGDEPTLMVKRAFVSVCGGIHPLKLRQRPSPAGVNRRNPVWRAMSGS